MKMKFATLILALIPTLALADFMPGRVRPLYQAELNVVEASGIFSSWKAPVLQQNFQDDSGFVSLSLVTSDGKKIMLPIQRTKNTGCGNYAWSELTPALNTFLKAEFADYSQMICGRMEERTWKLRISFSSPDGAVSVFEASGQPEGLFVTF